MSDTDLELDSWCDPHGTEQVPSLVGQIQFSTDDANLNSQDITELNKLRGPFSLLMLGRRVHFWCVGHADHRGTSEYNMQLGRARAEAVQQAVDRVFQRVRFYSSEAVTSRGETEAHWPMPSPEQMGEDRRVDIFASIVPRRPPVVITLDEIRLFGRLPPAITIREVFTAQSGAPDYLPAGRRTRPAPANTPPGVRGGGAGAAVAGALNAANSITVNGAIEDGLDELRPRVAYRMINHSTGGILIVAAIDVHTTSEGSGSQLMYVTDQLPVFASPHDGIGWHKRQPSLDASSWNPPFGRVVYRYFWATRARR